MTDVSTKNDLLIAKGIVTREGSNGDEQEHIEVPISSTRPDRDGDEFAEDALRGMERQIRNEQPNIFLNHGFTAFDKPLYDVRDTIGTLVDANVVEAKDGEGDKALVGLINPDTTHPEGERMLEQVRDGQAVKFSVGFRVLEAEEKNPDQDGDNTAIFKSVDLMETSKVGIPSNPDASASMAAKAAELTEGLTAAGVDIDDEVAFAKALAAELVSPKEANREGLAERVREAKEADSEDLTPLDDVSTTSRQDILTGTSLTNGTLTISDNVVTSDTKGACDSDADCPDGEVCVDGECVDEDSAEETDNFIMDDEAEERFASLEETIDERFASLEDTIKDTLTDDGEGEQPDDDPVAELDGLTDEQRDAVRELVENAEDADPAESETKNPDPEAATDPDEDKGGDSGEDTDHRTPEEYLYG